MRILLVNKFFYRKGGSETYLFALADGLHSLGHEVAFFAMQHPNNEPSYWSKYFVSEKDYNGETSAFRKIKDAATLAYSFEAKRKFEALCEEFRPDVVHLNLVHRQITFSILDAPYLKKHHVPVVYTSHEYSLICPAYTMLDGQGNICEACIGGHYSNVLKRTCTKGSKAKSALSFMEAEFLKWHKSYDKIDLIIACSNFMKKKLDEGGYTDKTIVMQNFLTDEQVALGQQVANTHKYKDILSGTRPYFLYFGRLSQEKGILTLVRAFIEAAQLSPNKDTKKAMSAQSIPENWDLHIVGEGPERHTIESLISTAGPKANTRIQLLGYRTGKDLQKEVGNAHFTILPSEWYENMPYSGLESLVAQTPVIGSDLGGIPELTIDDKTGFTFSSRQISNLKEKIIQATCIQKEKYTTLQNNCMRYIEANCLEKKYLEKLTKEYKRLSLESKKG